MSSAASVYELFRANSVLLCVTCSSCCVRSALLRRRQPGKVTAKAPVLLERIEQAPDQAAAREERQWRLGVLRTPKPEAGMGDPVREYRQQARPLLGQYMPNGDYARMDEAIATDMAESGRYAVTNIKRGIREGSFNVENHEAGHIED